MLKYLSCFSSSQDPSDYSADEKCNVKLLGKTESGHSGTNDVSRLCVKATLISREKIRNKKRFQLQLKEDCLIIEGKDSIRTIPIENIKVIQGGCDNTLIFVIKDESSVQCEVYNSSDKKKMKEIFDFFANNENFADLSGPLSIVPARSIENIATEISSVDEPVTIDEAVAVHPYPGAITIEAIVHEEFHNPPSLPTPPPPVDSEPQSAVLPPADITEPVSTNDADDNSVDDDVVDPFSLEDVNIFDDSSDDITEPVSTNDADDNSVNDDVVDPFCLEDVNIFDDSSDDIESEDAEDMWTKDASNLYDDPPLATSTDEEANTVLLLEEEQEENDTSSLSSSLDCLMDLKEISDEWSNADDEEEDDSDAESLEVEPKSRLPTYFDGFIDAMEFMTKLFTIQPNLEPISTDAEPVDIAKFCDSSSDDDDNEPPTKDSAVPIDDVSSKEADDASSKEADAPEASNLPLAATSTDEGPKSAKEQEKPPKSPVVGLEPKESSTAASSLGSTIASLENIEETTNETANDEEDNSESLGGVKVEHITTKGEPETGADADGSHCPPPPPPVDSEPQSAILPPADITEPVSTNDADDNSVDDDVVDPLSLEDVNIFDESSDDITEPVSTNDADENSVNDDVVDPFCLEDVNIFDESSDDITEPVSTNDADENSVNDDVVDPICLEDVNIFDESSDDITEPVSTNDADENSINDDVVDPFCLEDVNIFDDSSDDIEASNIAISLIDDEEAATIDNDIATSNVTEYAGKEADDASNSSPCNPLLATASTDEGYDAILPKEEEKAITSPIMYREFKDESLEESSDTSSFCSTLTSSLADFEDANVGKEANDASNSSPCNPLLVIALTDEDYDAILLKEKKKGITSPYTYRVFKDKILEDEEFSDTSSFCSTIASSLADFEEANIGKDADDASNSSPCSPLLAIASTDEGYDAILPKEEKKAITSPVMYREFNDESLEEFSDTSSFCSTLASSMANFEDANDSRHNDKDDDIDSLEGVQEEVRGGFFITYLDAFINAIQYVINLFRRRPRAQSD